MKELVPKKGSVKVEKETKNGIEDLDQEDELTTDQL